MQYVGAGKRTSTTNVNLPDAVWIAAGAAALEREITPEAFIIEATQAYVAQHKHWVLPVDGTFRG